MMKPLLLLSLLSILTLAERVKPIHMQAHDSPSYDHYDSGVGYHNYHQNNSYNNNYSNSYNNPSMFDDDDYDNNHYNQSTNRRSGEGQVISSTAEASAEITISTLIEGISEITSQTHNDHASMSFLENNRLQITEDIAHGEGEHIETLLTLMQLKQKKHSLEKLQNKLTSFLKLEHKDFLEKIKKTI